MSSEIAPRHVPRERPGQAGGRRDENRRQKTRHLCEKALPLFLKRGIEGVTIDDIVEEAGIAKGSFYRYFHNCAELVESLFTPLVAQVEAAFDECERALKEIPAGRDVGPAYQTLAQQLGAAILLNPDLTLLYLQECRSPAVGARGPVRRYADRIRERAIATTRTAHERGLLRPFDARVSALAVVGAVERLLFGALSGEDIGDPEQIAPALISLILDGARSRP